MTDDRTAEWSSRDDRAPSDASARPDAWEGPDARASAGRVPAGSSGGGNIAAIYGLILTETGPQGVAALTLAAVTGLFQAVVITIIAGDAEELAGRTLDFADLGVFCAALGLLGLALHLTMRQAARTSDAMIALISQRLARRVQRADLPELEAVGPERVHDVITTDLTSIGSAGLIAFSALKTGCLIGGCALIILSVAPAVAVLCTAVAGAMALVYRNTQAGLRQATARANAAEERFGHWTEQALDGFRELRVNRRKRRDLYDHHLLPAARAVAAARLGRATWFVRHLQTAHGTWFLLVGTACFIAPTLHWSAGVTTAVLILAFLRTPFVDVSAYLPTLVGAGLSIERLNALEHHLSARRPAVAAEQEPLGLPDPSLPFRSLRLDGVSYTYFDAAGRPTWSVGPLDLEITAGETVLIAGGNGSGKTTLLKLLTGLYPPRTGELQLDGEPVTPDALRPLVSTVFADFHLFDRLYGVPPPDADALRALLLRLDLAHKVAVGADRSFSTTALSSGQRRRLALLTAWFERRPILVFDEWTADQDPGFRRFFYSDILPELKRNGHTVIAVTHDDAWLDSADRLIRLADGRIAEDVRRPA